jgi:hypothetical protein
MMLSRYSDSQLCDALKVQGVDNSDINGGSIVSHNPVTCSNITKASLDLTFRMGRECRRLRRTLHRIRNRPGIILDVLCALMESVGNSGRSQHRGACSTFD